MKRFLLAAALLIACGAATKAQTTLNNLSLCDVDVTQNCYDPSCGLMSSTVYTVTAGTVGMIIPACGPYVTFDVCWVPNGCGPFIPCVTVDGSIPTPSPCGPGSYTGIFQSCDYCANNMNNGLVNVIYDPAIDDLTITP